MHEDTDTEERRVRGGGREGSCCPNREKIGAEKKRLFIH
jgi:hypothetical protein